MDFLMLLASDPGLGNLQGSLIKNWIGPAFFIVVAIFAIKFIISRQFRELAGFLGISAVVALLIFNGGSLFSQDGIFYKIAESFSGSLGSGGGSKGVIEFLNVFTR